MHVNCNLTSIRIDWDFPCTIFCDAFLCQVLLCLRVLSFDYLLRLFLNKGSKTNYWSTPTPKNNRCILPHIERSGKWQIISVLAIYFCVEWGLSCKMFSTRILRCLRTGFGLFSRSIIEPYS